ncbi:hypothetical protein ACJX0J_038369, partial [Zea mays]
KNKQVIGRLSITINARIIDCQNNPTHFFMYAKYQISPSILIDYKILDRAEMTIKDRNFVLRERENREGNILY